MMDAASPYQGTTQQQAMQQQQQQLQLVSIRIRRYNNNSNRYSKQQVPPSDTIQNSYVEIVASAPSRELQEEEEPPSNTYYSFGQTFTYSRRK